VVIFINGSFGVGKTTVSRLLARQLPGSVLFDPEPIGVALLRIVSLWRRTDDFQDLSIWRKSSIFLIRLVCRFRDVVVVPMAFSRESYLQEFLAGVRRNDGETVHFCLTAPLPVVRERLRSREVGRGPTEWQLRRSAECCEAHRKPEFAQHVATEGRSPQQIAQEILDRLPLQRRPMERM
jgi:predicted kinase